MDIWIYSTSEIGAPVRKHKFFLLIKRRCLLQIWCIHLRINNVKIEERSPAHLSSQHSAAHFSRPLLLEMEDRQTTGAIYFPLKQVNMDFLLPLVSLHAAADWLCNIASLNLRGCSCWPDIAKLVSPPRQLIRRLQTPALTLNTPATGTLYLLWRNTVLHKL